MEKVQIERNIIRKTTTTGSGERCSVMSGRCFRTGRQGVQTRDDGRSTLNRPSLPIAES